MLDEYAPTPILAPWNGGSGFYPKDKKTGIDSLSSSEAARFSDYRDSIEVSRILCASFSEAPKKDEKDLLLRHCRESWRGRAQNWLAAAVAIKEDGGASYPALLGTGGNDGRLDFTNNFMQRLCELFETEAIGGQHRPEAAPLLSSALWRTAVTGLSSAAIGQFHPSAAGGANSTNGFAGDSSMNPWDFVLMLEGAILFGASVVRRADTSAPGRATAPFAVGGTAAGYGSAASADESARGEQWMPLWSAPTSASELRSVLAEGRSQIGRRNATEALDFTRAVSRLGVARGITAFQRYGYIERNGQANLATPLGRWTVSPRPHQRLLDEVAPWISRLHRAAKVTHAPASFASASRRCSEAFMLCGADASVSERWQALLRELGRAERLAITSPRFTHERGLQPLPRLGASWLEAIYDGSVELRVAAALAAATTAGPDGRGSASFRRYWLPVVEGQRSARFATDQSGIHTGVEQVARGADLVQDLVAVLRRRSVEALRSGDGTLGIRSRAASLVDGDALARFIRGDFDDDKCLELAMPLMALDWPKSEEVVRALAGASLSGEHDEPGVVYGICRLALPLSRLSDSLAAELGQPLHRMDAAVLEHLASGQLPRGFAAALRRARASGFRPRARVAAGSAWQARRLAAALAIPIAERSLRRVIEAATKPGLHPVNSPINEALH
jgi:CRISPR-associated protein Csx17